MSWDKNRPDGSRPIREGDDRIRENFAYLEDTLAEEHDFGPGSGNTGRHKLRMGEKASRPSSPKRGFAMIRTDVPAVDVYDGVAWQTIYGVPLGGIIGWNTDIPLPPGFVACNTTAVVNGVQVIDLSALSAGNFAYIMCVGVL